MPLEWMIERIEKKMELRHLLHSMIYIYILRSQIWSHGTKETEMKPEEMSKILLAN